MNVLVVGSGLSGSTVARILAENGCSVQLIDKKSHVAGNAFDTLTQQGERYHKYGPHLLHGSIDSIAIKFLSRFTKWTSYRHTVKALLPDGSYVDMPVNMKTVEDIYGIILNSSLKMKEFMSTVTAPVPEVDNLEQLVASTFGKYISDILYRPYNLKMWGKQLHEIPAAVGARLPIKYNRDEGYFSDNFQALPSRGYTSMVQSMLDHPNIQINLNCSFTLSMVSNYDYVFNSSAIDETFNNRFGPLPYRSIKFENKFESNDLPAATVNFTLQPKYTRKTCWSLLPNSPLYLQKSPSSLVTYEVPCDPSENYDEKYYPVTTPEAKERYNQYTSLLSDDYSKMQFIGRCGTFQYLDMVPAVTQAMMTARKFLNQNT